LSQLLLQNNYKHSSKLMPLMLCTFSFQGLNLHACKLGLFLKHALWLDSLPDSIIHLRNDLYCVEWDVKLYYTIPYHNPTSVTGISEPQVWKVPICHSEVIICGIEYISLVIMNTFHGSYFCVVCYNYQPRCH